MLRHRDADGRTALSEMMARGSRPSWLVRAKGTHFDVKDQLRAQGFRWDAGHKVWAKEVDDDELVATQFWLAANVYSIDANPRALGRLIRITPSTRFLLTGRAPTP
ncbi:hypothetical protein AB5I41_25250 [Sphingomonas sp. MMS24-JH45]